MGPGWRADPTQPQVTFADVKVDEQLEVKKKLDRLKSLRPIPVLRSARRLERERKRLESRWQKLQEDIDLLGEAED
ncbi:MAG TPA: hypothetical protein VEO20_10595 [Thermoplasmata archaeon]|nr:hypothetical protein [Thermoplasmata archaeon]